MATVPLASLSVTKVANLLDKAGFECSQGIHSNSISGLALSFVESSSDIHAFASEMDDAKVGELLNFIKDLNKYGVAFDLLADRNSEFGLGPSADDFVRLSVNCNTMEQGLRDTTENNRKLQDEIRLLEAKNAKLVQMNSSLTERGLSVQNNFDAASERLASVKNEIANKNAIIQGLNDKVDIAYKFNEELMSEKKDMKKSIDELVCMNTKLTEALAEAELRSTKAGSDGATLSKWLLISVNMI
jgi:hypothetical protein